MMTPTMPLLLVLALLPFIYVIAWVLSPLLVALYSFVTIAERLRREVGPWAEYAFFCTFTTLIVFCGKSRWFFWFGLLPLTVLTVLIARL